MRAVWESLFLKIKRGHLPLPPQESSSILHIEKLEQTPHSGTTYKELWEFPFSLSWPPPLST